MFRGRILAWPSRAGRGDVAFALEGVHRVAVRGRESWTYERAGRPGRRCGTAIRRGEQGPPGQEQLRF